MSHDTPGSLVRLSNAITYFVPTYSVGLVTSSVPISSEPLPATILPSGIDANPSDVVASVKTWCQIDDVFNPIFLQNLVTVEDLESIRRRGAALQSAFVVSTPSFFHARTTSLQPGPYFICGNQIHEAWRTYPDTLDAIVIPVIPQGSSSDSFAPFSYMDKNTIHKLIAVPSRLYAKSSPAKPLAGKRITLKDNISLRGIQTTMSNRAWLELYGPEIESAAIATRLLNLGAVVVGKSKMNMFASGEEPTDQWIDFHCSFNPRGDGYQSSGGSSTGAGASVAGYEWLDFGIGTDTAGSILDPATSNGLFALRSTHGSGDMTGIAPACFDFDVIGFIGRDLNMLEQFVSNSLDVKPNQQHKFPKKILCPTEFFPVEDVAQQKLLEEYISILESFLGTKRTMLSIAETWTQHPPLEARGESFFDFMEKSMLWKYYYDCYHIFGRFRNLYKERTHREPYVSPHIRFRWKHGAAITKEQHEQGNAKLNIYRKWFSDTVMHPTNDLMSDAIMVLPCGDAAPKYRDDANKPFSFLQILSEDSVSPSLQIPQLVTPIGQLKYESRVSGCSEYRPICGTILGAKGSDLMLVDLIKSAFLSAGWRTHVDVGRCMLPPSTGMRAMQGA